MDATCLDEAYDPPLSWIAIDSNAVDSLQFLMDISKDLMFALIKSINGFMEALANRTFILFFILYVGKFRKFNIEF